MNGEINTLFRHVSPCLRFVEESRVSTRPICLRGVGRLSQFVSNSQFLEVFEGRFCAHQKHEIIVKNDTASQKHPVSPCVALRAIC